MSNTIDGRGREPVSAIEAPIHWRVGDRVRHRRLNVIGTVESIRVLIWRDEKIGDRIDVTYLVRFGNQRRPPQSVPYWQLDQQTITPEGEP